MPSVSGAVEVTGQSRSPSAAFNISAQCPPCCLLSHGSGDRVQRHRADRLTDSIVAENSAGTVATSIATYRNQPAGSHNQSWTGKDNAGKVLPNGADAVIAGTTTSGIELTTVTVTVTIAVGAPPPHCHQQYYPEPLNPSPADATINYTCVEVDATISV